MPPIATFKKYESSLHGMVSLKWPFILGSSLGTTQLYLVLSSDDFGYAQNELPKEALELFRKMQELENPFEVDEFANVSKVQHVIPILVQILEAWKWTEEESRWKQDMWMVAALKKLNWATQTRSKTLNLVVLKMELF